MFGRGKKTVSLAYKEKLLSDIVHYEKRIAEALSKPKKDCFETESSDDELNPYTLNVGPSRFELKQQEASLSDRASMTLELAMLTIMQSEVNVMVTPPELRRPVQEDGIWLEVAAECKIDLVSFTITFFAHKPHRRFAPTRYRSVVVSLVKPAHQKELAQSVLPKLNRPNLALQVLQSYASAFRSRRTTLLELAEKYTDKLRMEAMPEGGYRVRFLDLLQVDWTLENMWSPIVPFCHRMKFEVEYMPKDYIHAIGKLYKQFKDPSLETSERTFVLSRIFETCLEAQLPARELQDSLQSDPETAGSLHERRTTIDQEPDVPSVEHSPQKPKGKENTAQNRKTNMAPPKAIPKKAKKINAKASENRKGVKRGVDGDGNDAKRSRIYGSIDSNNTRSEGNDGDEARGEFVGGVKAGLKGGRNAVEDAEGEAGVSVKEKEGLVRRKEKKDEAVQKTDAAQITGDLDEVGSKNKEQKITGKSATNAKETDKVNKAAVKKGDSRSVKSKSASDKSEGSGDRHGIKRKDDGNIVGNSRNKDSGDSEVSSKKRMKKVDDRINDKNIAKDVTVNNAVSSKKDAENVIDKRVANSKNNEGSVASSQSGTKTIKDNKNIATSKDKNNARGENKNSKGEEIQSDSKNTNRVSKPTNKTKGNDAETVASSKTMASKASSKNLIDKNKDDVTITKGKNFEKETNEAKTKEVIGKTQNDIAKKSVAKISRSKKSGKLKAVDKNTENSKHNDKTTVDNINKGTKIRDDGKAVEKSEGIAEKLIVKSTVSDEKITKDKMKETTQNLAEKKKVTNKIIVGQKTGQNNKTTADTTSKMKEGSDAQKNTKILTKKSTVNKANSENNTKHINEKEPKNIIPKVAEKAKHILQEKTNRNETVQKAVDKNKIGVKNNATATKTNQKPANNLLNVTITKSKSITSKLQENQLKLAEKMKSKIPMMKNKMTFSSMKVKVAGNNIGRISKGFEKPNVIQKSLPVFKGVKNAPTRISPRKLPSTFKPSQRFSNK